MAVMKFLLIGGGGFLGRNIAKALTVHGYDVVIVDKQLPENAEVRHKQGEETWYALDVTDANAIVGAATAHKVDHAIILASSMLPGSPPGTISSEMRNVILPSFEVIERLISLGVRVVYFSSGGAVYGAHDVPTYTEDLPLRPISEYGYSKLVFEEYIKLASRTRGLEYLIIRPSNPFGLFQRPAQKQGLIAVAADRIINDQFIEIWGDGAVIRDYIWIDDLVDNLIELIKKREAWSGIYNIGSGSGHSVNEVIEILERHIGKTAKRMYYPSRDIDVPRLVLDISRLQATVPTRVVPFETAIAKYVQLIK